MSAVPEATLPGLVAELAASRHAGGYRFKVQERVLRQFAGHCRREGYPDGSITKEAVDGFLYGRHLRASTIRRNELALRQLAEYARAAGWDACTPAAATQVRVRHQAPYVFTDDEVRRLFAAIDSQPMSGFSNKAMVDPVLFRVLYGAGLRVSEALSLTLADADTHSGTHPPRQPDDRGDPREGLQDPVRARDGPTAQLVGDYLDHRDRHPGVGADADPLFAGPNHSRLTRSGVAKLLARHVRAVRARDPGWAPGLPVTPHTLRRSRAMHLVQAGVNLIYIRDLLGHADVSTTEIYARADAEAKRKAIENAYEPLTPDALPDWTSDSSLIGWLDSLGR